MARSTIPIQQMIDKYPTLPLTANSADFTFTASDPVNGDEFPHTGREIIIVQNTDGVNPHFVMITSVRDRFNRLGTIGDAVATYSVGANEYAVFPPFPAEGWRQASNVIYLDSDDAQLLYAVLRLPA